MDPSQADCHQLRVSAPRGDLTIHRTAPGDFGDGIDSVMNTHTIHGDKTMPAFIITAFLFLCHFAALPYSKRSAEEGKPTTKHE